MWWVVAVVAVVVCVATYLTWTASRVDRLHARAAAASATLDAHLVRRSAAAVALAETAQLPTLAYAARIALNAAPEDREAAENDLTRQLRAVLAEPGAGPPPGGSGVRDADSLVAISRRVALARQVHNDVVRDALGMRRRRRVRLFRLARRHPVPAYFDIDDPSITVTSVTPSAPAGPPSGPPAPAARQPSQADRSPQGSDWPSEEPVAGA